MAVVACPSVCNMHWPSHVKISFCVEVACKRRPTRAHDKNDWRPDAQKKTHNKSSAIKVGTTLHTAWRSTPRDGLTRKREEQEREQEEGEKGEGEEVEEDVSITRGSPVGLKTWYQT